MLHTTMELEAKIERLEAKIDRVEAKEDRVEQALEEGTAYLGTTDHGELMATLHSLRKEKEQLREKSIILLRHQASVSAQQLGSAAAYGRRNIAEAPKATPVEPRGHHQHQQPMQCLPAPPMEQKRCQELPSQPQHQQQQQQQPQQQQQQLIIVGQRKHEERPRQEQQKSKSKPISPHASSPPSAKKPDSAVGGSLETQAPPSPPPPDPPALIVEPPAPGSWAAAEPHPSLENQEPQQPKATPDRPAPPQPTSPKPDYCTGLSRETQTQATPPSPPARSAEPPSSGARAGEGPDSPRDDRLEQQQVVPGNNVEGTDDGCGGGRLPEGQQFGGTHVAAATPAVSVEPALTGAAGNAGAPVSEAAAAAATAAGGISGESSQQPAGQREDDGGGGERRCERVGAPPSYPATGKTSEYLPGYVGEVSSAASTEEFAGTPAADGQVEGNIQIFFKSPQVSGDKTMTLDVSPNDTVEEIKLKIQIKEGTPVHFQRLIYNCRHLENDLTVAQCNIQRGSTIHSFLSWSVPELSLA